MIPSNKWFPVSISRRAGWYTNFAKNIAVVGADMGLSPAEIASIADDAEMMRFLSAWAVRVENYASAAVAYRRHVTEGEMDAKPATFPTDLVLTPPDVEP